MDVNKMTEAYRVEFYDIEHGFLWYSFVTNDEDQETIESYNDMVDDLNKRWKILEDKYGREELK